VDVDHGQLVYPFLKDCPVNSPANGTSATMPAGISELMGGW